MLRVNASRGYVAAADIGGTRLRMMLADLNGTTVSQWAVELAAHERTPQDLVALVHVGLQFMHEQAGRKQAGDEQAGVVRDAVLHLAVGAPGITDVDRGVVIAAPNLSGWNNVPLRSLLERETGIATTVENDVNLAAVGEHHRGVAATAENFLFVAIGTGVGAGIFLRGLLYHGADWSAGELGYLPVAGMPRQAVRLAETGPLERLIGGAGIEAYWQELLRSGDRNGREHHPPLRARAIFDLAEAGDVLAGEVLTRTSRLLAEAIGTVALLYNPALVVLGGGVGSHRALCQRTQEFLGENEFALPLLRSSSLGTEAQLLGAIAVALAAAEAKLLC